jgi:septal ring factor EnvC (AmiA/AmiB activator)
MKKLTLLGIILLLISCGKNDKKQLDQLGKLGESIGQTPKNVVNELLGTNKEIRESEKRSKEYTDKRINELQDSLNALYDQVDQVDTDQDVLSQTIALNQSRLASLEDNHNIAEIVDPCGDNPNEFDEVLLKTDKGEFLAYFEQASKRYLTKLPSGNYMTTDNQACKFNLNCDNDLKNCVYSEL